MSPDPTPADPGLFPRPGSDGVDSFQVLEKPSLILVSFRVMEELELILVYFHVLDQTADSFQVLETPSLILVSFRVMKEMELILVYFHVLGEIHLTPLVPHKTPPYFQVPEKIKPILMHCESRKDLLKPGLFPRPGKLQTNPPGTSASNQSPHRSSEKRFSTDPGLFPSTFSPFPGPGIL